MKNSHFGQIQVQFEFVVGHGAQTFLAWIFNCTGPMVPINIARSLTCLFYVLYTFANCVDPGHRAPDASDQAVHGLLILTLFKKNKI